MQIILSPLCASLTGTLDKTHGYAIRRYKHGFFSVRTPRPNIPADGHWRFILACAELAQMGLHLSGIRISGDELLDALSEAFGQLPVTIARDKDYTAREVLSLAKTLSLSIASASDADI